LCVLRSSLKHNGRNSCAAFLWINVNKPLKSFCYLLNFFFVSVMWCIYFDIPVLCFLSQIFYREVTMEATDKNKKPHFFSMLSHQSHASIISQKEVYCRMHECLVFLYVYSVYVWSECIHGWRQKNFHAPLCQLVLYNDVHPFFYLTLRALKWPLKGHNWASMSSKIASLLTLCSKFTFQILYFCMLSAIISIWALLSIYSL
jgi:hypothetical protein